MKVVDFQSHETPEIPSFFPIEIGLTYPSDAEIERFIVSLTTYIRNGHPLTPSLLDRTCELFSQYEQRILKHPQFSPHKWLLFSRTDLRAAFLTGDDSSWRVLLSTNIPQLRVSVIKVLATEISKIIVLDVFGLVQSDFIPILLTVLDEQTLFSTPLSDPIHPALLTLFHNIFDLYVMDMRNRTTIPFDESLFISMINQLRPFLLFYLKHPTFDPFPQKPTLKDNFHLVTAPDGTQSEFAILPIKTHSPIIEIVHKILDLDNSNNSHVSFIQDLMEAVREERRKEGLAKELEPLPLFMTARIASDQRSVDLVPILESCNDFILSHISLSNDNCIDIVVFILLLNHFFSHETNLLHRPSLTLPQFLLSKSPQLVSSLTKLFLLALSSSSEVIRPHCHLLVEPFFVSNNSSIHRFLAESGFVPTLLQTARELDIPNSAHAPFFQLTIQLLVRTIVSHLQSLKDSDLQEGTEGSAQFVVDRILVPCREFVVLVARSPSQPIDHLKLPLTPIRHRQALSFFEGVWKEVREEAIGLVRKEGSAELPSFLTIDLFGQLESDSVQTALLSLSSFLHTHPTPPDPIAASIHLFLSTLTTARLLPQPKPRRNQFIFDGIFSPPEQLEVVKWLSTDPTNRDIVMDSAKLLHSIISESQRDVRLSLAQNGLIHRLLI
ncbi:hypothetical protein BLNAU_7067 [Blattamonas nauphoetae]|uniref:Uncharacterized protein n=1 Tax=Blattamonas nauphoetae TaxID=2049346 RepID=A0ABQ9Y2D6_9EUKA|nr:hypothetical protein BLNAU_7067 [Blattamonas nauphoetae]